MFVAFRLWRKEHRKGHPKLSLEFLKLCKEPLIISKLYISTAQDGLFKSTFSNVNHTNKLQFYDNFNFLLRPHFDNSKKYNKNSIIPFFFRNNNGIIHTNVLGGI